ncbi:reverse transcriptase domain-containing protein [Tanacetum coccineum]
MEEQEATVTKALENLMAKAYIWKLYINGASKEHGSGAGIILIDLEGAEYSYALRFKIGSKSIRRVARSKSQKAKKYKEKALEIIRSFSNFQISHIPREENRKANTLSKLAAVQCEGLTKRLLIEELNERSVDMVEVNAIIEEAIRTWMTPIQEYIKKRILPEDATEARTIRKKARNYTIEEGVLYRKSYLGPLL